MRAFNPNPGSAGHNRIPCFLLFAVFFCSQSLWAQPVITSFAPAFGPVGTSVTINGTGFDATAGNNIVYFGAVRAIPNTATATTLVVNVPIGATCQQLTVTSGGLTGYSAQIFTPSFAKGLDTIDQTAFAAKKDFATAGNSVCVRIMDLEANGKPELIVSDLTDKTISIYKNTSSGGTISFSNRQAYPMGTTPWGFDIGDLNGDGLPEIVSANGGENSVTIDRNASFSGNISFYVTPIYLAGGGGPHSVAIGDLDGDGRPDIAAANTTANTISVYKNTTTITGGAISCSPKTDFAAGTEPNFIAIGDLDGDGKPDIAVTNFLSGTVSIFRNLSTPGNISFAAKTDFASGNAQSNQPRCVSIADLDGDGKPDLAIANYNSGHVATILRNTGIPGTISFDIPQDFGIDNGSYGITVGDINGDGKPDLAVASQIKNRLSLFMNTGVPGTLSFDKETSLSTSGFNPSFIALGDLDGDKRPDMAVTSLSVSMVSVFRNTVIDTSLAINSFSPASAGGGVTVRIKGRDFNHATGVYFGGEPAASYTIVSDTIINAVVGEGETGNVRVITTDGIAELAGFTYTGPAVISFTPDTAGKGTLITIKGKKFTGATGVRFGNIPATSFTVVSDTMLTAIVGNGAGGVVSVTTPNGTASSIAFFVYSSQPVISSFTPVSGPVGTTVTISGVNFDSAATGNIVYFGPVKAAIISASASRLVVTVPAGAGSGILSVMTARLTAFSKIPFSVTFAGGDIAFTPSFFAAKSDFASGAMPTGICASDFDGDGKPDIAIANDSSATNTLSILRNTSVAGKLSFGPRQAIPAGIMPDAIASGDFDGDGKPDLVVINGQSDSLFVYANNSISGTIAFGAKTGYYSGAGCSHVAIADINGDGRPDLAVADGAANSISVYINTSSSGIISFAPRVSFAAGASAIYVVAGDLNGDGKPDIAVVNNSSNTLSVYINRGGKDSLSFARTDYATNTGPVGVAAGDLNGDGRPDLVVSNSTTACISVFKNAGNDSFAARTDRFLAQTGNIDLTGVAIADLNGDGRPDVLVTRNSSLIVAVLKGQDTTTGDISLAAEQNYTTGYLPTRIATADIDGDGKPDVIITNTFGNTISILRNAAGSPGVKPSGANPVSGSIAVSQTIDPSVQSIGGTPYVQRHYDVEPANNAAAATATITLYFTQADFDAFNAYPGHGPDLPHNVNDSAGKANLRIYQYHGFSTTSQAGSYTGAAVVIDPADSNIAWNAVAQCWAISFNVSGFSGFFISNVNFNYTQIAVPVISATGSTSLCDGGSVVLSSSAAANNQWYKNGIAISGATGTGYQASQGGIYTVTTAVNNVSSQASAGKEVTVVPLPAKPTITRNGSDLLSSAAGGNQWYREGVLIAGATGQTFRPADAANYTVRVTTAGCTGPESDKYNFSITGVINLDNTHYIRLSPNPIKDQVWLSFNLEGINTLSVQVVDLQGRVSITANNLTTGNTLNLSRLAAGVYLAKIYGNNGKLNYTMKMMKQ